MDKYTIGIDFGTLSARAVLVNVDTGEETAVSVYGYQDAVIDRTLPGTNIRIPVDFALQNPRDYVDALQGVLREVWRKASIQPRQVIGIGIDFTSCTVLPVDKDYVPLCYDDRYRNNIHSWVKIWKHHGAQQEAQKITRLALARNEEFIKYYGNVTSSEWLFAKLWETLNNAPEVYAAAYRFMEAGDWVVYQLTGRETRNSCAAGYKAFWRKRGGFPSDDFFAALDPRLQRVVDDKLGREVTPIGRRAGTLTAEMAEKTGLWQGLPVGVANTDAHLTLPAVGICGEDTMLMIMGTSLCHILLSKELAFMEGIGGVVEDGVLPGCYGYEAGQAAVGDIYNWFVSHFVPHDYIEDASRQEKNTFDYMNERAARLLPGESGLLALDWWNGNRSMLNKADVSGMLVGMTIQTEPEYVYRALIEGTALGTRYILESLQQQGLAIREIYACGGLPRKSATVMQIFSDVIGKNIKISGVNQASAYGAAMYGAVAAGRKMGGFDTILQAAKNMPRQSRRSFAPNMEHYRLYNGLFEEYKKLHDYFGRGGNDVMRNLKKMQGDAKRLAQRAEGGM